MRTIRANWIAAACVLLVIAAVTVYLIFFVKGETPAAYSFQETGAPITYAADAHACVYAYGASQYYLCTKDGVRGVTSSGQLKWNVPLTLTAPSIIGRGTVAAVAESRGTAVYVFNPSGLLYQKTFDYPLLGYSVTAEGRLSVILQTDTAYQVLTFSENGDLGLTCNFQDDNVYPVTADISGDGKILAVSLYDVSNVRPTSKILFLYTDAQQSKSFQDSIFATRERPQELVGALRFLPGNRLVAVSDKALACYQPGANNTVSDLWQLPLHNEISQMAFDQDGFAYADGVGLLNDFAAGEEGTVHIVSAAGEEEGTFLPHQPVTYLSLAKAGCVLGLGAGYTGISRKGDVLWQLNTLRELSALVPLESMNTVLQVSDTQAGCLQRSRGAAATSEDAPATEGAPAAEGSPDPTAAGE